MQWGCCYLFCFLYRVTEERVILHDEGETMNAIDTVKTCITALQSGDIELAASILSDDFLLTGLTPNPMRKNELLALQGELLTAMPDFSYNLAGIHREERDVIALIQITGTHTRDLTLSVLGLPTIQATG